MYSFIQPFDALPHSYAYGKSGPETIDSVHLLQRNGIKAFWIQVEIDKGISLRIVLFRYFL